MILQSAVLDQDLQSAVLDQELPTWTLGPRIQKRS